MNATRILGSYLPIACLMGWVQPGLAQPDTAKTGVANPSAADGPSSSPRDGSLAESTIPTNGDGDAESGAALEAASEVEDATPRSDLGSQSTRTPAAQEAKDTGSVEDVGKPQTAGETAQPEKPQASAPNVPHPTKIYQHRFGAQAALMMLHLGDRSYDLFSDRDLAVRFGLVGEADLLRFGQRWVLSVDAGWAREGCDDELLEDNLESKLDVDHYSVGGRFRFEPLPWLMPHARLTLGMSDIKVRFASMESSNSRRYESDGWLPFTALGVGLSTLTPPTQQVVGFFQVEAGYLVSASMPLALDPDLPKEALPTAGAKLGELGRSGAYLAFAVGARF